MKVIVGFPSVFSAISSYFSSRSTTAEYSPQSADSPLIIDYVTCMHETLYRICDRMVEGRRGYVKEVSRLLCISA